MPSYELTGPQQELLDAYRAAAAAGERPPTLRELCLRFRWSSTGTARDHLKALVRKGALQRGGGARNYGLVDHPEPGAVVPLVGRVAAGRPILAIEHVEGELTVPAGWVRRGTAFALRVEGESMTGVGILDGDVIVALATNDAKDRDIVVARNRDEVTVKRLHLRGRNSLLLPENRRFKPIAVDEETTIDGIVVGLIRDMRPRRGRR